MEGNLVVVYAGSKELALEFAKMVFSYPEVVLVTISHYNEVEKFALDNQKQVIGLESIQEAIQLFGPDEVFHFGKDGKEFDVADAGGDLKEGQTTMFVFGAEKSDTTFKKWTGDIGAVTIVMYELGKVVDLGR